MKQDVTITCALGLAPALSAEVKALGFEVLEEAPAAVSTRADVAEQIRLCLWLRTAHRVLVPFATVNARDPKTLAYKLTDTPWETVLGPDGYVRIHGSVKQENIRDERIAFLSVKDAVMDRLRSEYGRRPDSGPRDHGASLYVRWVDGVATVSLDLAGRPLSSRGYRVEAGEAPLRESLAAGILLTGGWPGNVPLTDPMCGSGTLVIEAALMSMNRAPNVDREEFSFRHLLPYADGIWNQEREAARNAERGPGAVPALVARDLDPRAVERARANAERAEVADHIAFQTGGFEEVTSLPAGSWVVMNPPYGERLEADADLERLYRSMGVWLKGLDTGGHALVITGNLSLSKRFGLKLNRKHTLYNGSIECRLLDFPLFPPGGGA